MSYKALGVRSDLIMKQSLIRSVWLKQFSSDTLTAFLQGLLIKRLYISKYTRNRLVPDLSKMHVCPAIHLAPFPTLH